MYSVEHLIDLALQEDIGPGDITTDNLVPADLKGFGFVVAKESFVVAGLDIAQKVFQRLDPDIRFHSDCIDGDSIDIGRRVFEISGKLRVLLTGERTALNFMQRLSGIATSARVYMDQLGAARIRLVDTRKTTPGWRILEKYAVRVGGACNHRMGLYDGVLIKDNHIAVCGGVGQAIRRARKNVSHLVKIEVEVSDLAGVKEALDAGADVIMLDNMNLEQIAEAAAFIHGKAVVEVSGGITRKDLSALAGAGVDIISVGALTHSAVAVDMSMQIQTSP
jgi:nicotinate-nucleotide pyrophosphorylase (carboxylating)